MTNVWRLVAESQPHPQAEEWKWLLTLVCGHQVSRPIRYRLDADVDTGEAIEVPHPAPRKVRCPLCPTPTERTAP